MPEHIFGYNKSKQMRIIQPPLSPNKYSKFSSVRVLSIQYEMRGSSVQSASSNHRAQYVPGCIFVRPVVFPYHFSAITGDLNSSTLYLELSNPVT